MRKFFLIPLMALFACVSAWAVDITTAEDLKTFLEAEGTAEGVLKADVDITSGVINAVGTKTLSTDVEGGVTVTYKTIGVTATDGSNGNANIALTGTLTILGEVKFDGYQEPGKKPFQKTNTITDGFTTNGVGTRAIDVQNGGKLILGEVGVTPRPYFHQNVAAASSYILAVRDGGEMVVNNAEVQAERNNAVRVYGGNVTINGGLFNTESHARTPYSVFAYGFITLGGQITINNGQFSGNQGGFGAAGGRVDIYNGEFSTHHAIFTDGEPDDGKPYNHYALYVSTGAIVNVHGGKYKVEIPSAGNGQVMYIGNNDTGTNFGIINLYGGTLAQKPFLQKKRNTDDDMVFPASVPLSSQWYSNINAKSTEVPMPVGYDYEAITSGADYEAGYRWQVVCTNPNTDAIDDSKLSDPTIPWQQSTTWTSNAVPEDNTVVTIPKDATVVVSKDETTKEAEAEQVFVNQGATLKVETGTTLTVGDGGVNIANGGSITVEPGATVKIGSAGIVTAEEEALVIESNDDIQGVLLYDPVVAENTQPKATVKLTTKAKQIGANSYVFERFAIPTIDGSATTYSIEGGIPTTGLYNDAPSFLQAVWEWNNATDEWEQLDKFKDMQPFHGYQLTNNSAAGGLVYVFEGNLVGNQSKNYEFVENGFHFFGNSYSADINIKSFLNSLGADVEKTVWVYDPYDKTFKTITERMANGRVRYGNDEQIKDIRSMQAFLMYLSDGESGTANVNYASAIWGNPKYNGGATPTPAPARHEATNEDWVTIRVSAANGLKDEVILNQSEDFTAAFENGADANKFMNNENINLYAVTNAGNLAVVATDDLNNTVLTFAAGNADEYTLHFNDIEGYEFTLRDNVTGATVLMTEGATYKFNQDANTTIPARFEIIGAPQVTTAIDNVEESAKKSGIYTITGQFLGRDFSNLPAGVYVVNGVKIVK